MIYFLIRWGVHSGTKKKLRNEIFYVIPIFAKSFTMTLANLKKKDLSDPSTKLVWNTKVFKIFYYYNKYYNTYFYRFLIT